MNTAYLRVTLLKQQADDETTSVPVDVSNYADLTFYLFGHGTTSGGTITYEEASDDPRTGQVFSTGVWSIIGSANNASDVTSDKVKAAHLTVCAYHYVRARISDAITGGGTISVVLVARQ